MRFITLFLVLIAFAQPAEARSAAERRAFQREQPCPSTGKKFGACFGYVVDHKIPLCAGGPDLRTNMQWQTVAAGHAKDKLEWAQCRALNKK